MKKTQFVKDLGAKDNVATIFMVKYIAMMEARNGSAYLNVILADSTGDIESRKWHGAENIIDQVGCGDYVYVEGKINQFQNRLQLIVQNMNKVDTSEIDLDDFLAKSANPPDEMFAGLIDVVSKLDDVYIRDLLQSILFDPENMRRIKIWPAGKTIHHAYKSGLLEHIHSCLTLATKLSTHYKVNMNYVVAGTILHDFCKIYELSDGPLVEYTDEGKLLGHVVKVLEVVDRYAAKIKNFPYQTKVHLKHILLSHHGEYSFGSPKTPMTSEACLVHLIDLMDSKMASFDAIKKGDSTSGKWSGYVKHLDRMIFKEELPTNTDYIQGDGESMEEGIHGKEEKSFSKKKRADNNGELKHSLADKLKGFKIE